MTEWQAGRQHRDDDGDRAGFGYIRGLRQQGITFERVRMLAEPLTPYLEWMLATTNHDIEAGEDVRRVPESTARQLGMPGHDFYVFDDDRVVIMRFVDHLLAGAGLVDDPDVVNQHQQLRDRVRQRTVRHQDYLSTH